MTIRFPSAMRVDTATEVYSVASLPTTHPHKDCCGCWTVTLDERDPMRPFRRCNECGEIEHFKL